MGFSALCLPALSQKDCLASLKRFRGQLRETDEILTTVEFHASKFTSGRGRLGPRKAIRRVSKERRCEIFDETLAAIAALPNVQLLNAFRHRKEKVELLERLLNRIHRAVEGWGSYAVLFFDEGDNRTITRLTRRLAVFNPIRSQYGYWPDGREYRNIPTTRFLEDPVFRASPSSYFIQAVDFCAYALFQKEKRTPSREQFGLHTSFENHLAPICVRDANTSDTYGIVR